MISNKELIFNVLSQTAFIRVNKIIASYTSLEAAVMLSDLIGKHKYFIDKGQVDNEGYFFNIHNNIENDTTLSKKRQITAQRKLVEKGLLKIKRRGMPSKNYYLPDYDAILNILTSYKGNYKKSRKGTSTSPQMELQEGTKGNANKIQYNNILNNNNNNNTASQSHYKSIMEQYFILYEKRFKKKPTIDAQEGRALKNILKSYQVDEIVKCLEKYIYSDDKFYKKQGYTLRFFQTAIKSLRLNYQEEDKQSNEELLAVADEFNAGKMEGFK